jgi:hypothetical protein
MVCVTDGSAVTEKIKGEWRRGHFQGYVRSKGIVISYRSVARVAFLSKFS